MTSILSSPQKGVIRDSDGQTHFLKPQEICSIISSTHLGDLVTITVRFKYCPKEISLNVNQENAALLIGALSMEKRLTQCVILSALILSVLVNLSLIFPTGHEITPVREASKSIQTMDMIPINIPTVKPAPHKKVTLGVGREKTTALPVIKKPETATNTINFEKFGLVDKPAILPKQKPHFDQDHSN